MNPLHDFAVINELLQIVGNDLSRHNDYVRLSRAYNAALHPPEDSRPVPKFKLQDKPHIEPLDERGVILGRYWHFANDKFPLTWVYLVKPDSRHEDYSVYVPEYGLS